MRLFSIGSDGAFTEYDEHEFKAEYREDTMEDWLESNPDAILEDSDLMVIGRQVSTNLNTTIDLLGLDAEGNVAVVELKRGRTPREVLAQALEYASFASALDSTQLEQVLRSYTGDEALSLAEVHRQYFTLDSGQAVAFNKEQRIVVVANQVSPAVRQAATYLRANGLRVTCLEFGYFRTNAGEQLLSVDIVVGHETARQTQVTTASKPKLDKRTFLARCDDAGRALFERIIALGESRNYAFHWGVQGFSLNVPIDGRHLAFLVAYSQPVGRQYPQSLWTSFWTIRNKIEASDELVEEFRQRLEGTGLFEPGGQEMKLVIDRPLSAEETDAVIELFTWLATNLEQRFGGVAH